MWVIPIVVGWLLWEILQALEPFLPLIVTLIAVGVVGYNLWQLLHWWYQQPLSPAAARRRIQRQVKYALNEADRMKDELDDQYAIQEHLPVAETMEQLEKDEMRYLTGQ